MIALLDTSTPICKLTLVAQDGTRHHGEWQAGRTLARDGLAYLRDRLAEHDLTVHDLTALGVLRGPGSFTGLRIGITIMNTLADALQLPIVGTTGDDWQDTALDRLAAGENDRLVMPEYGGEAHITQPRK